MLKEENTTIFADISSANPSSRRHHRVPIPDHYGGAANVPENNLEHLEELEDDHNYELYADSRVKNSLCMKNYGDLFGEFSVDEYMNYLWQDNHDFFSDDQYCINYNSHLVPVHEDHYDISNFGNYGHPATNSLTHTVSTSALEDVSVVPDSSLSNSSILSAKTPKEIIEVFSDSTIPMQMPQQFKAMDREARVLRYKEKKKMRKFEKTIRYASRKAYAETRPRIKGRFAKRINMEVELVAECAYGVVPTF